MIARKQQAAAVSVKAGNPHAVCRWQAFAAVDREQPQLVEPGLVELAQNRIALRAEPIARGHRKEAISALINLRLEKAVQQGEASDVPIVRPFGNGRLQQNSYTLSHDSDLLDVLICREGSFGFHHLSNSIVESKVIRTINILRPRY
jgi:hypothetical protein